MFLEGIFILPEIIITVMSCTILLFDLFISEKKKEIIYYLSQITLILVIFSLLFLLNKHYCILFNGSIIFDFLSILLKLGVVITTMFIFLYSKNYLKSIDLFKGEYFVLCLLSILGMMIMISSGSFLTLYLGLELLSLPIYSLIIMNKSKLSSEASMKYFIMGSIASGIFLFGISIVYGMTGSIDLFSVNVVIRDSAEFSHMVVEYGLIFIISGLIFKFGAVPFHMWVPDVYEGSPIPITLFIGTIPKLAAVGMSYRLLIDAFPTLIEQYAFLFTISGILSLFFGNIFALSQCNVKRLLGYSAISHMGFLFFGLIISDTTEFNTIIFYIFIYIVSSMTAFTVIMAFSNKFIEFDKFENFKGLGIKHPLLGIIMLLSMFSLAGVPPTGGFYAKFFILRNLIFCGYIEIALFAVIMSVIGAFYYLKLIKFMFFDNYDGDEKIIYLSNFSLLLLFLNGILILFIGLFPSIFLSTFDLVLNRL